MALFFVAGFVFWALMGQTASPLQKTSEYCAVSITVRDPSGKPAANIPVELALSSTRRGIADTKTDRDGVASFCDVPFKTLSIAVGTDICGSIVIRNLTLRWPESLKLPVTYTQLPCPFVDFSSRVQLLIRVRDQANRPLSGCRFHSRGALIANSSPSDARGRIFLVAREGSHVVGTVIQDGLPATPVEALANIDSERTIVIPTRRGLQ